MSHDNILAPAFFFLTPLADTKPEPEPEPAPYEEKDKRSKNNRVLMTKIPASILLTKRKSLKRRRNLLWFPPLEERKNRLPDPLKKDLILMIRFLFLSMKTMIKSCVG